MTWVTWKYSVAIYFTLFPFGFIYFSRPLRDKIFMAQVSRGPLESPSCCIPRINFIFKKLLMQFCTAATRAATAGAFLQCLLGAEESILLIRFPPLLYSSKRQTLALMWSHFLGSKSAAQLFGCHQKIPTLEDP